MVARHDGAVLLDVTSSDAPFRNRDVFAADLFHPSEVGHSIWADAITRDLRAAFDRLTAAEQNV